MIQKLVELRWGIYDWLRRKLIIWGLRHGYAWPYGEALLEKLRTIYYGGVPASILLLCNGMSNGHCYDRATLMARAFLDEDGDVRLIYASVASLRWNPLYADYIRDDASMSEHCFVEITETDGRKLILDTSSSFIWDKRLYWLMERPSVRMTRSKSEIKEFVEADDYYDPEDLEISKYWMPLILPMIELTYGRNTEMYSQPGIEMLQREVELYKETIDYDSVCREVNEDMRARGFGELGSFA